MSNRQARREQARASRAPQRTRSTGGQRRPTSSGGGGSDIFSRGFLLIFGALLVVAAVVLVLVVVLTGGSSDEEFVTALEEHAAEIPADLASGTKLGKDDAPVKIVSYEDFQCPFCLQYTAEQEPDIINELVKTGKVQLEYRHLPILGPESVDAAEASQCAADQGKFWQYHNRLFLEQAKAGQFDNEETNVGRYSPDKLKQFASDLGLDRTAFDSCLDSGKHLELVTNQQREANQFGITGTPGFLVNGQPLGSGTPQGIDAWKQIVQNVENAIATATANAGKTPTASATAAGSPSPAATATPTKAP